MEHPRFNPSQSVRFDLARGVVSLESSQRLLVPAELLGELWAQASADLKRDFGRRLGTEIGRRVTTRLGADRVEHAAIDVVVEHLGGDLALTGLGNLSLERWGRALVLTVADSPLHGPGDELLAAIVEGAVQRLLRRDTGVVVLTREDSLVRLLVVNPTTAQRVKDWLREGVAWGDALTRLNAGKGAE